MTLRRGRLEEWKLEDDNKFYFRPELVNPLLILGGEVQADPFLNSKAIVKHQSLNARHCVTFRSFKGKI